MVSAVVPGEVSAASDLDQTPARAYAAYLLPLSPAHSASGPALA
jgi:hypothetical protein